MKLKIQYLRSVLKQEYGFFEEKNVGEMPAEIDQYFSTVTQGIGEAYGQLYQAIGCLSGGITLCFVKGPIFFLISAMYIPFFLILSMFFGRFPKDAAFLKM